VAQWGLGRHEEGIAPLRAALEATDTGELDADVAALNVQLGRSLTFTGRFEEAGGPLDAALTAAEALGELDVLTSALVAKGTLYLFIARWREAIALLSAGTELARERGLSGEEQRGMTNMANAMALMDRPESREHAEAALAVTRRGGSRSHESLIAANLCSILLFTGRWGEIDRLASELMPADGDGRPLGEYLHERLLQLHALRGDVAAVREDLANLGAWARTDDPELREAYAVAKGIASAVEDGPPAALETLLPLTRTALETAGTDENLRYAWAATIDALFALGRIDEAEELVEKLARRPPGRTSPYLRAQRDRARAMVAVARGDHEAAGAWFRATVDALRALDYRYWLARAQTDYAAWLIDQGRRDEAAPLLEEAIGVLEDLGAAPALERAGGLREAVPVTVPD